MTMQDELLDIQDQVELLLDGELFDEDLPRVKMIARVLRHMRSGGDPDDPIVEYVVSN
jgi:hypothetical protein